MSVRRCRGRSATSPCPGTAQTYGRPFHNIDLLRKGDRIVVETKASYVVYSVARYVIVTPDKVEVIAPVPQRPGVTATQAWMTLTTSRAEVQREVPVRRVCQARAEHPAGGWSAGLDHGRSSRGGDLRCMERCGVCFLDRGRSRLCCR